MSNARPNKPMAAVTVAIWLAAYAGWTADWLIYPMPHLLERSLLRVPLCGLGIALCVGMASILMRVSPMPASRRLLVAGVLCVGAAIVQGTASVLVFGILFPLWEPMSLKDGVSAALSVLWVFLAWTAAAFGLFADAAARDSAQRVAALDLAVQRARHAALASHVHPHFLFNALNTVSGLLLTGETSRAERVTMALSGLLRRSIEAGENGELVPLHEEMDAVSRYLEIERVRFEDKLAVETDVAEGLENARVPPMLLQPLVENAVKHGVARAAHRVTIRIRAEVEDGRLVLEVSDDAGIHASAPVAPGIGYGHRSIAERLQLTYESSASLEAGPSKQGYTSRVIVPLR